MVCPIAESVGARRLGRVGQARGVEDSTEAASDLGLVGRGAGMERLRMQLRRIAPHFRTVLLTGETGTGKEVAARALHQMSRDPERPFVVWGGAEAGDALDARGGAGSIDDLLRKASGGTLFLDQVGDLSLPVQGALLRSLEQWERGMRSAVKAQAMATRVIASTRRDLKVLMKAGGFREDLYYRIAMVEVGLPALRDHREDIGEIAASILERYSVEFGREAAKLSAACAGRLMQHFWRGNVRELENVLLNALVGSSGGVIELENLFLEEAAGEEPQGWAVRRKATSLQEVMDQHVQHVLRDCSGNKARAAEVLGISRSTLYRMLEGNSGLAV